MNTERYLPQDAVYGIAGLAFTVVWHVSILGLVIAIATLLLVPRDSLLAIARADRVLQLHDAFPAGTAHWGDAPVPISPRPEPAQPRVGNQPADGDIMMAAYRAHAPHLQPLIDRLGVYWLLIRNRLLVLAGFLPGLGAMTWGAWGFGAHLYAVSAADGTPLSTLSYKYWKMAMGACGAALFSFPFWPCPLTSWCLLLPICGLLLAVVYTRRWRAS
jgi:hypothetical protein